MAGKTELQTQLVIQYQIACGWGRSCTQAPSSPAFTRVKSLMGSKQAVAEQGRKKKGGGGMTSRHLWRLKLKQTGKKKKKSSSPGKVVITVQSAIHLTKSHTGTVLMGGSRLMEGCRLKRGSSDVVDIFIWAMLSPFNYFRQDD